MRIAIGVGLPGPQTLPPGEAVPFARRAEQAGLDAVGAADLLLGDGTSALDPVTTLAAVAGGTTRLGLGFGVLAVPTRPLAMLAAQVQTLQLLSGGRVRLGLGIGGFPEAPFWSAVGAPVRNRGGLLDRALEELPRLIEGKPGDLVLAPAAPVPPMLVGSGDGAAQLRRIAHRADGWLTSALPPDRLARSARRLSTMAQEAGRPAPRVGIGLHSVLGEGPTADADRDSLARELAGFFGMSAEEVGRIILSGPPSRVAEQIADFAAAGAHEVGVVLDGSDLHRQLDLLVEAVQLLERA